MPPPASHHQVLLSRSRLGCGREYVRSPGNPNSLPFPTRRASQASSLAPSWAALCQGWDGRSPVCLRFPSSPAAGHWQDGAVLQLQPSKQSPLTPHIMLSPSQLQQHVHQLHSSLPPGCPQTPTCCLSPLLIFSPRPRSWVLWSCCQQHRWGKGVLGSRLRSRRGQARVQSALPCQSPVPHRCLEGHSSTRTSPTPGGNAAGSNPDSRSEAGGRAEATCAACHICKESMAQGECCQDREGTDTSGPPGSPALPQVPPSLCPASPAPNCGVGTTGSLFTGRSEGNGAAGGG